MAIGSMNVSNNSKINDEIKSLHDKDTEIETTLNTKANNDDIAIRSVSDTSIQLTDAKDANMLLDHAPINMLNITITSQTINGLTITVNPDKSIYVKGTATKETTVTIGNFYIIKGQKFSFGQAKSVNGYVGNDGTSWNNCAFFYGYDGTADWKFDGIYTATVTTTIPCKLYVRNGTTVDCTYYPRVYYENKRYAYVPPEGYEIVSCGKNLIDVSNGDDNTWIETIYTVGGYKQKTIKLKPNTKYTISQEINKIHVTEGDSPWSWIFIQSGHANYKTNWYSTGINGCLSGSPRTITSDAEGFITIAIWTGTDDNSKTIVDAKVQLEEGDTATNYEPFIGKKVTIDRSTTFPLTGLDSYNELTNIYNSYGATMDVSYASNASGKSIMNKITMIEDELTKNTIHWIDYSISGIAIKNASTSTSGYYYSDQIYPDLPSNAKIVSVISYRNFIPGLSYIVFENSFVITYVANTTIDVDVNRQVRIGYILT